MYTYVYNIHIDVNIDIYGERYTKSECIYFKDWVTILRAGKSEILGAD